MQLNVIYCLTIFVILCNVMIVCMTVTLYHTKEKERMKEIYFPDMM